MITGKMVYEALVIGVFGEQASYEQASQPIQKHYDECAELLNKQLHLEEMTQLLKDYRERLEWLYDILACTSLAPNDLHLVCEQLEKRGEALGLWKRCDDCQMMECICDEKGRQ